jgi:hypothetical protein|tara:strand:- start:5395 stop:5724 length:330 start_codon:yes stop_codon:yes gene_type:complete
MHSIEIINRQNHEDTPPLDRKPSYQDNPNDGNLYARLEGRTRILDGTDRDKFLKSVRGKSAAQIEVFVTAEFEEPVTEEPVTEEPIALNDTPKAPAKARAKRAPKKVAK